MDRADDLTWLVEKVRAGKKYRTISEDLILRIATDSLARQRARRDALKATRSKLHQVAGAYAKQPMKYAEWLADLASAVADEEVPRDQLCAIMAAHASTAERLPLLDAFYPTLFADLPPIASILDLACGLNPLTLPWMWATGIVPRDATYYAYDIYHDQADFLNDYFRLLGVEGKAVVADLVGGVPEQEADIALLFKVLPVLEQVEKGASLRLLDEVNANIIFVSYPAQSLGGRHKGMPMNYESQFHALIADRGWAIEKMMFATESVFRVVKDEAN